MAATLLLHGYWEYPAPDRTVTRILGEEVARRSGFDEALALEDTGQPMAVLAWARTPERPSTVRAIVEMAYQAGMQGGRFDEVRIATALCPTAVLGAPQTVHLHARRRSGAICYRLTDGADTVLPSSAAPLQPEPVYESLCGEREALVARSLELLLSILEPKYLARGTSPLAEARHTCMPKAISRFYDFAEIEDAIYREVVERALKYPGFKPPER